MADSETEKQVWRVCFDWRQLTFQSHKEGKERQEFEQKGEEPERSKSSAVLVCGESRFPARAQLLSFTNSSEVVECLEDNVHTTQVK